MQRLAWPTLFSLLLLTHGAAPVAWAEEDVPPDVTVVAHLTTWGAGEGPKAAAGRGASWHLLDDAGTKGQLNTVALDAADPAPAQRARLQCNLHVDEGGDGGSLLFLDTRHHGERGPAPFLRSAVEPNLKGTFAVGIDVHNPPDEEMFSAWGNYQDLPQREISLHFDGRELVKRVAPVEFRGWAVPVDVDLVFVTGGAEVTVEIAGAKVYDAHFLPHVMPYPMRPALAAGTRTDATTVFHVTDLGFDTTPTTAPTRPPLHVELFHHVMTHGKQTAFQATVDLPPPSWAFGRIILTLDIHDGGRMWDEWDRNGEIVVKDDDGTWRGIVPFITSYRTPCHWKVDLTHFRPWLHGKRTFEIRAGTTFYKNRGYLMSASLDFHHGTPEQEAFQITPLWHGTARYQSDENRFQDFYTPQEITIPKEATASRIWTTTTGHSQVGEFTPSRRAFVVQPDPTTSEGEMRFHHTVWKSDVYLNPNRPQFGTWKFSRAGWAPGDIVHPWWIELGDLATPGAHTRIRCETQPYAFPEGRRPADAEIAKANHVVRSYVIHYRPADALVPAPVLRITNVEKDSNADKAGMKSGDYLAAYDGKRVDSIDDLRAALQGAASREGKVPATLYRGTERIEIQLDPGRMGINLGR